MAAATLSSATGILSLLDEDDAELQTHGLKLLDGVVDEFWSEIAVAVPKIETMYEDEEFENRHLAAFVASKVFYHLEELDDALKYALGAGSLFNVETSSQYVETLIAKCVDEYIRQRKAQASGEEGVEVDVRLVSIMEKMFERCFADGRYEHACGIAIESRRFDVVEKSISISPDVPGMLAYVYKLCTGCLVESKKVRLQLLQLLVKLYQGLEVPNYFSMCQCLLYLDDSKTMAATLGKLLEQNTEKSILTAYQMAFDLFENENVHFMDAVLKALPDFVSESEDLAVVAQGEDTRVKLKSILDGTLPTNLYLHFLYGHCKTDLGILSQIKIKSEVRNSVAHTATVIAHAIMNAGTTVDVFLRDDIPWLGRANNWAKFTATASIGVIHMGHHEKSLTILDPYLPKAGTSGSPYQEGGALYAMGLIHARSSGNDKKDFLLEALNNAGPNEIIQHGACLGIGLVSMGSYDLALKEKIMEVIFSESAVAGEAAAITLGLIMLGSGHGETLDEMLEYAQKTQHLRIVRGLSIGMALVVHGKEEEADGLIEQMIRDKNATIRFGGMYAIAMAYCATSNNNAIRKLLHVAVSDVDEDVRRAAVTALGFILCNNPSQVPKIVSLLSESYSPYVRQGACMAVGVACAGQGTKAALELLEPLLKDRVDYVRQAALIASAMILTQQNESVYSEVASLKKKINEVVESKGDTMTKMGAIMAAGIIDAGGRNMTMGIMSASGHMKRTAAIGMMMFNLFWYWYPYAHFISLALTPTAVVGLNKDLKMPTSFKYKSNAPPSMFAYPPPIETKKKKEEKKVKTATLSVTNKAKAKAKKKKKDEVAEKEEKEVVKTEGKIEGEDTEMKDVGKSDGEKKEEPKKESEPAFEELSNPARVTWQQQRFLSYNKQQRYVPVTSKLQSGVVLLMDTAPGEKEEFVESKAPKIGVPGVSDDEPDPPAPFEFTR